MGTSYVERFDPILFGAEYYPEHALTEGLYGPRRRKQHRSRALAFPKANNGSAMESRA